MCVLNMAWWCAVTLSSAHNNHSTNHCTEEEQGAPVCKRIADDVTPPAEWKPANTTCSVCQAAATGRSTWVPGAQLTAAVSNRDEEYKCGSHNQTEGNSLSQKHPEQ